MENFTDNVSGEIRNTLLSEGGQMKDVKMWNLKIQKKYLGLDIKNIKTCNMSVPN